MGLEVFFSYCRRVVRKFPYLRKVFLSVWPIVEVFNHQRWNLRNTILGNRPVEVKVNHDTVFMLPEGHIAELIWRRDFEKPERDFISRYLKPGMRVLNIGANVGLYSLIAGKIVGQEGEVHAFEPSSLNFDRLKRNVALNGLNNVQLNQLAVSDFKGALAVMRDPAHPDLDSHFFVQRVEDGKLPVGALEQIPCNTIDDYWSNCCINGIKKVDMMIIDVEGGELSVFKGAVSVIGISQTLMIMVECTEHLGEISTFLSGHGFSFFDLDVANGTLSNVVSIKRGNIFAYRKDNSNLTSGILK